MIQNARHTLSQTQLLANLPATHTSGQKHTMVKIIKNESYWFGLVQKNLKNLHSHMLKWNSQRVLMVSNYREWADTRVLPLKHQKYWKEQRYCRLILTWRPECIVIPVGTGGEAHTGGMSDSGQDLVWRLDWNLRWNIIFWRIRKIWHCTRRWVIRSKSRNIRGGRGG